MSREHYMSLDGLRGVAILLVVFYHCYPHRGTGLVGDLASGGWLGVDLFFVLSGFLITGILYDTKDTPHFYGNFYMRRALRLFPLYLVFIAVVLLVARGPGGHPWIVTLAYLFYGSNIVRYFLPAFHTVGPVGTGHLWSLAVEEQFYLLWPWLVVALRSRARILKACLIGSVGALALRLVLARYSHAELVFLYLELPTRADSLLAGAAVAMMLREPGMMARLKANVVRLTGLAAAIGFVTLAVAVHTFSFAVPPINTWGLTLSAIGSACVLILSLRGTSWTNRILSARFLRFYGKYSYGLYLVHMAPLGYYQRYVLDPLTARVHPLWLAGTIYTGFVLGVSTAVAMLSFHLLEQPFLKLKGRFESKPAPRGTSRLYIPVAADAPVGIEIPVGVEQEFIAKRTVHSG